MTYSCPDITITRIPGFTLQKKLGEGGMGEVFLARPYLKRALLYKQHELYQKALDDLQAALDGDATLVDAWTGRGSVYVQLEDYARAIPELDRALALEPHFAEALSWRGRARYKLGDVRRSRCAIPRSPWCMRGGPAS